MLFKVSIYDWDSSFEFITSNRLFTTILYGSILYILTHAILNYYTWAYKGNKHSAWYSKSTTIDNVVVPDNSNNSNYFMYADCNINKKKIPDILKHDIIWDADECIKQGLVDHTICADSEINLAATLIKLARL